MFIVYIILILIALALVITLITSLNHGAPYVPSSKAAIRDMLKLANVRSNDIVLDLGSGDGRVLVMATEEYGANGLGIEITWFYSIWSKVKVRLKGLQNKITIKREDMYKADISSASVVVCFLLQDTNQKIKDKLAKELKPGTRIVSHYFTFDNWEPVKKDLNHYNYLYIVPKK